MFYFSLLRIPTRLLIIENSENHTINLKCKDYVVLVPRRPAIITIITSISISTVISFPPVGYEPVPRADMSRLGWTHSNPPASNELPIRPLASILGVIPVPEDYESIVWSVTCKPNLFQGPELHKNTLQVLFPALLCQICDMKSEAILVIFLRSPLLWRSTSCPRPSPPPT